jgi:hypothetical protein
MVIAGISEVNVLATSEILSLIKVNEFILVIKRLVTRIGPKSRLVQMKTQLVHMQFFRFILRLHQKGKGLKSKYNHQNYHL